MADPTTLRLWLPLAVSLAVLFTAGVGALALVVSSPPPWRTGSAALERLGSDSPWRWCDAGKLLFMLAFAQFVRRSLPDAPAWDMLAFQGALIAGILWLARKKKHPFGVPRPWLLDMAPAILRWLAILPFLWFASFVWQWLLKASGHSPDLQQAIRMFIDTQGLWSRLGFLFFATFVAPIAEEALFRGILLPLLVRRVGPGFGVVATSLGFAVLHADAGSFVALAVFAVALSLAYARTGSLRVPILMHMAFNGANLLLLLALMRSGLL